MPKVSDASKDHGQTSFIGSSDNFLITNAASRLNNCCGSRVCDNVQAISKGEEGVRRHHSAGQAQSRSAGFGGGNLGGVYPAHLARANAQRHTIASKYNGVGLNILRNLPGKQ